MKMERSLMSFITGCSTKSWNDVSEDGVGHRSDGLTGQTDIVTIYSITTLPRHAVPSQPLVW